MKLFKLTTKFYGKDLEKVTLLGFVVADTEEDVARHINWTYHYGEWLGDCYSDDPADHEYRLPEFVKNKGDFHTEYAGEFYDQKYGWEEMYEVTDEQIAVLRASGALDELITSNPSF